MRGSVVFNGVFELREGVSEEEFLPTLKAFYEHFIEMGFASGYRILRREASENECEGHDWHIGRRRGASGDEYSGTKAPTCRQLQAGQQGRPWSTTWLA